MIRTLLISSGILLLAGIPALAQGLNCAKFTKNSDGSWSPKGGMAIRGPTGTVQMDQRDSYKPGTELPGLKFDIAAALNAQCK